MAAFVWFMAFVSLASLYFLYFMHVEDKKYDLERQIRELEQELHTLESRYKMVRKEELARGSDLLASHHTLRKRFRHVLGQARFWKRQYKASLERLKEKEEHERRRAEGDLNESPERVS